MADLIRTIAFGTGIDERLTKKGMALVLSYLRQELPGEAFARISHAILNANQLLETAKTNTLAGRLGLSTDQRELTGNFWGQKAPSSQDLATQLANAGFSDQDIARFVAGAMAILRENVPSDVAAQIGKALQDKGNTSIESEGARIVASLKKFM